VFREAYAEHPDYVRRARRAGELWDRFGDEAGTVFLYRCGMLNIGTEDSCLIAGIRASAAMHSLKVEELSIGETAADSRLSRRLRIHSAFSSGRPDG
jgi:sarcosine oxidase